MVNRKDLRKLKTLLKEIQCLQFNYDNLSIDTKEFLLHEFTEETELHLLNFENNLNDAIREVKSN